MTDEAGPVIDQLNRGIREINEIVLSDISEEEISLGLLGSEYTGCPDRRVFGFFTASFTASAPSPPRQPDPYARNPGRQFGFIDPENLLLGFQVITGNFQLLLVSAQTDISHRHF